MSGDEIHLAVAEATGEDIQTIAKHGFVLLDTCSRSDSTIDPASVENIDWDESDLERYLAMCG